MDINRGRGPVADATDELTPVDIKISLLFLTALSQLFDFFSLPLSLSLHPIFPKPLAPLLFYIRIIASASSPRLFFLNT